MSFAFEARGLPKYWCGHSQSLSHFFNALSAVFPDGEQYFIDAVRAFEHVVDDPRLQHDVREFTRQEGHHTHHHRQFNRRLEGLGVSMDRCADIAKRILERSRRRDTPMMQLAMTAAFEHFTALMGDWLLRQAPACRDMHPAAAPLWIWHAAEEIEHKAVAFDVYNAAGGGYWLRIRALVRVTRIFIPRIHHMQCLLIAEDPQRLSLRDLLYTCRYLYGRGGFIRALLPGYLRYFRPDFHPWQDDNLPLMAAVDELRASVTIPPAA